MRNYKNVIYEGQMAFPVTGTPSGTLKTGHHQVRSKELFAAEFFAGIGLVRQALEAEGWRVVFANDIEPIKHRIYCANFGSADLLPGDIREVRGDDIPSVELATASFPCTDLSMAGNRAGLKGIESSMFWQFHRILTEMDERRPPLIMLENVPGFVTSQGGADLESALRSLSDLGYWSDVIVVDAKWFVPQSRVRLFIVGTLGPLRATESMNSDLRPEWLLRRLQTMSGIKLQQFPIGAPPRTGKTLLNVTEKLSPGDERWWSYDRLARFVDSLSPLQQQRLKLMRGREDLTQASAYRRTRGGKAVWEIRSDAISGCLRTAKGGSSKQALVETEGGVLRVRWMTAREYARLQGVPDSFRLESVTESQALYGLGDAVCVPAVRWIAKNYLNLFVSGDRELVGQ